MIPANELRIGNYVAWGNEQCNNEMFYCQVKEIYDDSLVLDYFHKDSEYIMVMNEEVFPISIGEKLLNSYGFSLSKIPFDMDCALYEHKEYGLFLQFDWRRRDEGYTPLVSGDEFHSIGVPLKSLHHLQNLFFALFTEELTTYHLVKPL